MYLSTSTGVRIISLYSKCILPDYVLNMVTSHKLMYIPCFETAVICSRELCDALCARPIYRRTMCRTFKHRLQPVYSVERPPPAVKDARHHHRSDTLLVSFLNLLSQQ